MRRESLSKRRAGHSDRAASANRKGTQLMSSPKMVAATFACGALLAFAVPAFAGASKSDIQAFEQTKMSARDAVSAAEKASGGKAMDVSFTTDNKKPIYDVTVLKANATHHYIVDADAGMAREKQGVKSKVSGEPQSERASAKIAKVSLSDAIGKAEASTGGKVIGAELEVRGSTADYDVEVVKGGASEMYMVDAGTGAVAPKK
jgi:uncharacterized membrane protein YkoI